MTRRHPLFALVLVLVAAAAIAGGAAADPPVITVPGDMTVEATSPAGAVVTYEATAVNAGGNPAAVDCTPPSGDTFALGDTTVSCTVSDNGTVESEAHFTVHVVDTTPPTLVLPGPTTASAPTNAGVAVTYTASASDLVDGAVTPNCTPASGDVFPVGDTTVSCTATDTQGNSSSPGSFVVTVTGPAPPPPPGDTTPPVFGNVPGPLAVEAVGPSGATVPYTPPTATDANDGPIAVVQCVPGPGSTFALGQTTVECSASDQAGNRATTTFTVTVVDSTPPTLSVPGHTTVQAAASTGIAASDPSVTAFLQAAIVDDLVDSSPTVTTDAPATFPIGDTPVTFRARDHAGNTTTKVATLTVLAPAAAPSPTPAPAPTPAPPPPAPPVVIPPPPDPSGFGATAARGRITLRWTLPRAAAFDHVELLRAQASNGIATTLLYTGKASSFVDGAVQDGATYRYQLVSVATSGDRSTGVALTATPLPLRLLAPLPGKTLTSPPELRWLPTANASYYNVQLFRNGQKVLSTWPAGARLQLKAKWSYLGHAYRLGPGTYRWYVWAGFGPRAQRKYSPLLGQASFAVGG